MKRLSCRVPCPHYHLHFEFSWLFVREKRLPFYFVFLFLSLPIHHVFLLTPSLTRRKASCFWKPPQSSQHQFMIDSQLTLLQKTSIIVFIRSSFFIIAYYFLHSSWTDERDPILAQRSRLIPSLGTTSLLRGAQRVAIGSHDEDVTRRRRRLRLGLWRFAVAEKLSRLHAQTHRNTRPQRLPRQLHWWENIA